VPVRLRGPWHYGIRGGDIVGAGKVIPTSNNKNNPRAKMEFKNGQAARRELEKLRGYPAAKIEGDQKSWGKVFFVIACGYGKYLREDGTVE
jgi:hypothetical protein